MTFIFPEKALRLSLNLAPIKTFYRKLRLFDKLTLGVLAGLPLLCWLAGKIAIAGPMMLYGNALVIIVVLLLIHRQENLPPSLRWLRDLYPVLCLTFFFGEVGQVIDVFFPFWLSPYLIHSDLILLGGMHGWEFFTPHLNVVEVEILSFAYLGYFLLIPLVVWLHYRAPASTNGSVRAFSFERVMARLCVAMYTCYGLFLLLPAAGPHHALDVHIDRLVAGGFFFHTVLWIQKKSAVVGAAFPSAHVAATWILWFTLRRDFRKTFWLLFPAVALLTISTFLLQYHYIVDAAAGVLLSFIIEAIMTRSEAPIASPAVHRRAQYAWQE